jgi:hypothetical protein
MYYNRERTVKEINKSQAWWHITVIPALGRNRGREGGKKEIL